MAGLTPTGFSRKRLEDVKLDLENGLRGAFGDIDISPQSVFGQLIGPVAQEAADLWELAEDVWLSQNPEQAEGVSLESACLLVGVTKLGEDRTSMPLSITGAEGTVVPNGTLVRGSDSNYSTQDDLEITQDNLDRMRIKVTGSNIGELFSVIVDGVPVTIAATTSSTATTALELANQINDEPVAATAQATSDYLDVFAKGVGFVGAASSTDAHVVVQEIASPVLGRSVANGAFDITIGSVTGFVTPVANASAVTNRKEGVQGRITETDAQLRTRRRSGVRRTGSASVAAMQARLVEDVPNVITLNVFDNPTDAPDIYGRPPHSLEVVAEGAEDTDLANFIWKYKPGGIQTYGNTEIPITDIAGNAQTVRFSRPAPLYTWARITILSYNTEERFPATGTQQISDNIVAAGNALAAGVDVIRQRLFSAIYRVPGVEDVKLELATTPGPDDVPSYAEVNIVVSPSQRARFASARTVVVP